MSNQTPVEKRRCGDAQRRDRDRARPSSPGVVLGDMFPGMQACNVHICRIARFGCTGQYAALLLSVALKHVVHAHTQICSCFGGYYFAAPRCSAEHSRHNLTGATQTRGMMEMRGRLRGRCTRKARYRGEKYESIGICMESASVLGNVRPCVHV